MKHLLTLDPSRTLPSWILKQLTSKSILLNLTIYDWIEIYYACVTASPYISPANVLSIAIRSCPYITIVLENELHSPSTLLIRANSILIIVQ